MARQLENPMAPPGQVIEDNSYVMFYRPLDPRKAQFRRSENFVSLLELCDPTLFETPTGSDEEVEAGEITNEGTQDEPVNLVNADSFNALIAQMKNAHKLPEEEDTSKKEEMRALGSRVQSTKSAKSVDITMKCHSSLISCRSNSQSSTSSTEMLRKCQKSASRDKSFLRHTSSNRRSISPHRFTVQLVEYQNSSSSSPSPSRLSSHRKSSSSKRRTSPNRSSPARHRRSRSRIITSATHSHSPSPTSKLSSRYKSPSPTSKLPSHYRLPSKHTLSKQSPSPRRRSSPVRRRSSLRRSPSLVPSPARSSSRSHHKSYKKSSKHVTSPVRRSPTRERSLTPHQSASHGSFGRSLPKPPSRGKRPRGRKPQINLSPDRPKEIAVEVGDEYTELLVEEMKKRKIYDGGDLEVESELPVAEPPAAIIKEKEIQMEKGNSKGIIKENEKEPVKVTNDLPLPRGKQDLVGKESGQFYEERAQLVPSNPQIENAKVENTDKKSEVIDQKGNLPNSFYCPSCQLSLNSESTWQSHINGKKHAKVLKLQTVHEIAKGSIGIPSNPAFAVEEIPRFANPTAGTKHHRIRDIPRLQPAIENCNNYPLLGLQFVREIRAEMEVHYYCEMCDAPCSAHSIMPHLTGYKHQLRFLKEIEPACYEKNKLLPKKRYESQLASKLFDHERKFGRGEIKVYEEREDRQPMSLYGIFPLPGPSGGMMSSIKIERDLQGLAAIPANDECLDVSKADFYCKLCDAHMNNINMWEAHVRGKRHLTNAKKIPGENISKVRSVKAPPNVKSMLEQLVRENAADEIVVGLDFIRETQGLNGEIYNCFLCGSCCTNFDIVNHLLLTKHRIRYLEKLVADGKTNGITTISQMDMNDDYFRKNLIDHECLNMLDRYGSGSVEVYLSKK